MLCVTMLFEIGRQDADFGHKYLCKPATYDTGERSHHDPNETVWDENQPEKLVEQFQVLSPLEDEASVRKADQYSPECVAEKGRVKEYDVEKEMGDVEILAPKKLVNVVA